MVEKGVKTMVEYGEIWRFVSWNDANFTQIHGYNGLRFTYTPVN